MQKIFTNEEFFVPFFKMLWVFLYYCYSFESPSLGPDNPQLSNLSSTDLRHLSCLKTNFGRLKQDVVFIQSCFTTTVHLLLLHPHALRSPIPLFF